MLEALISQRLITPPAIWGKLPGHADFVRSGVRHGESEGWQTWLAEHAVVGPTHGVASLPAAFVLPPGSLAFAPWHFVLGVITPSEDRTGRRHPLLIYQRAHARWVRRHFDAQARNPREWLFWLARAVGRHAAVRASGELRTLERAAQVLWQLHGPDWRELGWAAPGDTSPDVNSPSLAALDRCIGLAPVDESTRKFVGVRYLPWGDWPARLHGGASAQAAFWQQDATGGFVNASTRLADLWRSQT
jgi:type VI secretion system protein ImpM